LTKIILEVLENKNKHILIIIIIITIEDIKEKQHKYTQVRIWKRGKGKVKLMP